MFYLRTSFFLIGFYTLALVCLVLILKFGVMDQVHPPSTTLRGLFVLSCAVAGGAGGAITIFFWKLSRYLIGGWGGFALALFVQCFRNGGLIRGVAYRWIMYISEFSSHSSTTYIIHLDCRCQRHWILYLHHPKDSLSCDACVYRVCWCHSGHTRSGLLHSCWSQRGEQMPAVIIECMLLISTRSSTSGTSVSCRFSSRTRIMASSTLSVK